MMVRPFVKVQTPSGIAFVVPSQVIAVLIGPTGGSLRFADGRVAETSEPASEVAERLWSQVTRFKNGFVNVDQITSIEPRGAAYSLINLPGLVVEASMSADLLIIALRQADRLGELNLA